MKHYLFILALMWICSMNATEIQQDSIKYYDASQFKIIGKVYPNAKPTYARVPDSLKSTWRKEIWNLGQNSSGIAIRFRSNSSQIWAKWKPQFDTFLAHMTPTAVKGLDLYCWTDTAWRYMGCAMPYHRSNNYKMIGYMDKVEREYMMFLPLYDGLDSLEIGVDADAQIAKPKLDIPNTRKPIVWYGTSILQGACASRPGMDATAIVSRKLNTEVINLGFSGNAFIDEEVGRMMADVDASVYVLDYVPNAYVPLILERTEGFVKMLRKAHPDVPIIFIEDPQFAHAVFDHLIAKEIKDKNDAMDKAFKELKKKGIKNIYYIPSSEIVSNDGDSMVDGIHFTDRGFEQFVNAVMPLLKKLYK